MHLVMFDIDGTLVDSAGFDADLYAQAVEGVLDIEVDRNWDAYEHISDSGILDQLLRDSRFDSDRAALAARVQQRFVGLVRDYLRRGPVAVREIAGAKRLVERLLALPDVRVAIATGGWEPTARLKLEYVGIDVGGAGFASSSDARDGHFAPGGNGGRCDVRRASFWRWSVDRRASASCHDSVAVGGWRTRSRTTIVRLEASSRTF
jgi:phosphoglycolate phosphatase-like HAD superfamily hydrolase